MTRRYPMNRMTLGTTSLRAGISRTLSVAVAALALSACSWFTDFKDQPDIDPWQSPADRVGG
jgi:hypothetical protein